MADIHLIDGEKGGVGKSLFARLLLHYWLTQLTDAPKPVLFDTDASRKDVERFYGNHVDCGDVRFSDDDEKLVVADEIFQTALLGQSVVVNLGASVYEVVRDWIVSNGLIELGKIAGDTKARQNSPIFQALVERKSMAADPNASSKAATPKIEGVRFFKWFVCSGQQDSLAPFHQSLEEIGDQMPHILVENRFLYDDQQWEAIEAELAPKLKQYNVKSIYIPKLLKTDLKMVLEGGLTWAEAIKARSLSLMARQRLFMFCETANTQIAEAFANLDSNTNTKKTGTKQTVSANGKK